MCNDCQRSSHTFCGRCARAARQNHTKSDAKSRDFPSKPAQFGAQNARKQCKITSKRCIDASHHLHHPSITSSCAARSQRKCRALENLQKPMRTHAIFINNLQTFRAHRTAHSKVDFNFTPEHTYRLPAMIAHTLRSMHACVLRRNHAESHPKSRDFPSKPAQFSAQNARKQSKITSICCTDAARHLQHT